ncbi:MAG: hypothetical protein LC791_08395 [Acidobacteria bacterium]|nr:hypothetical protein [Acidobacteriota bacterium]
MRYSTPELVLLGSAPVLVLGPLFGEDDSGGTAITHPVLGLALGLDD